MMCNAASRPSFLPMLAVPTKEFAVVPAMRGYCTGPAARFMPAVALDQPIRARWRTITAALSSLSPFALHVYTSSLRLR
jgi:hypothetical protein